MTLPVVLLALTIPVAAIQKPLTRAEKDELAAINAAIASEKARYTARSLPIQNEIRRARSDINDIDKTRLRTAEQQLTALDASHAAVMDGIVTRTVKLFKIAPNPTPGRMVIGVVAGSAVTWRPTYAKDTTQRHILLPDGRVHTSVAGPNQGVTFEDGTVSVNDRAFDSAGYLGAVLYHESFHFEQNTTPGVGDVLNDEQKEIRAHSQSNGRLAEEVFGLTAEEKAKIQKVFEQQIEEFQKNAARAGPANRFGDAPGDSESRRDRAASDFAGSPGAAAPLATPYALQPAGPTASSAERSGLAPASPSPARASEGLAAAQRVPDEEVAALAAAACRGDWQTSEANLYAYPLLSDFHLRQLAARQSQNPCVHALLHRLVSLRRSGDPLSLARLRAETEAITTPPPDELFIERESRAGRRPCVQRGVWFKDCY